MQDWRSVPGLSKDPVWGSQWGRVCNWGSSLFSFLVSAHLDIKALTDSLRPLSSLDAHISVHRCPGGANVAMFIRVQGGGNMAN